MNKEPGIKNIVEETKLNAVKVLEASAKPEGFHASGLPGGYEALWARDSMITSLGGCLVGTKFKKTFQKSLELLGKNQSELGQIPNAVGSYNIDRRSDVTFNSIDSTLWYLIGNFVYSGAYGDKSLLQKNAKNILKALDWLRFQDPNEDKLLVQQPTMDWQDAFPHKYGRAINTEALYYAVLTFFRDKKTAIRVKRVVNGETEKYLSLYDKKLGYYLPWVWKNHDIVREEEYWFDSLGNLLAVVTGLAAPDISKKILDYIEKNKINRPYPVKAIWPPIKKGDKEWKDYFSTSDARTPYEYLNGGIWPMVGAFYVAALVKVKKYKKAEAELEKLAEANKLLGGDAAEEQIKKAGLSAGEVFGFHEWLHGKTGRPMGQSNPYQAWSAGAYLYAYECVKKKKVLFFK
ncbi:hypothetical protein HYT01_03720 [Candidatus Giovannonibacteria bacterium]|nr:hypothetical protein [Candidatus Giovannonibacteria bacterium]